MASGSLNLCFNQAFLTDDSCNTDHSLRRFRHAPLTTFTEILSKAFRVACRKRNAFPIRHAARQRVCRRAFISAPIVLTNSDFRFIVTEQFLEAGIDPGPLLIGGVGLHRP